MSKPGKKFGGANQYKKILLGLVNDHEEDIRHMGIDPKQDIGVHSIRKGAATYVCSDTTCAPSIAPVYNCAGWTMCKVKDTYIQYEAAMDQVSIDNKEFCYASLIYSQAFLSEKVGGLQSSLQSNHFLRREARMSDSSLVLGIRYAHEECSVPLTGIPPHIIYLVQIETVLSKVKDIEEKQHSNVDLIVE